MQHERQPNQREYEDFLRQESDHFFQAELYHDQRANWLLALASGLLTALLGALLAMGDGKLGTSGRPLMIVSAGSFTVAILVGLWTLWPLAGREGHLWNPFKKKRLRVDKKRDARYLELHYEGHRHRAGLKASRIVFIICFLYAGVLCGLTGIGLGLL